MDTPSLLDRLDLHSARCIAAIGAGGKSSTLDALAWDMSDAGLSVISTTTTHVWVPAKNSVLVAAQERQLHALLMSGPAWSYPLTVASHVLQSGKLRGLEPGVVCRLSERFPRARILVEADGAAGRPLKAHGLHEPLVPECANVVLLLVGVWALGAMATDDTIHRIECFPDQAGSRKGELLVPEIVARLICSYRHAVPDRARPVAVLNGAESNDPAPLSRELEGELNNHWPELTVIHTWQGRPAAAICRTR